MQCKYIPHPRALQASHLTHAKRSTRFSALPDAGESGAAW